MDSRILLDKLCELGMGQKGTDELKENQTIYWMHANLPEANSIIVPKSLIEFLGCEEVIVQTKDAGDPEDFDRIGFVFNGKREEA